MKTDIRKKFVEEWGEELATAKGDLDYLALFCGAYNYYCQKNENKN